MARFHLPPPFGRSVAMADGPIHVPPDLDREATERLRAEIEARLDALAARADAAAARIWAGGGPGRHNRPFLRELRPPGRALLPRRQGASPPLSRLALVHGGLAHVDARPVALPT